MSIRSAVALALWTLVSLPSSASAAVITVDPAGGGDFLTVQEGIDAAADGDTLVLADGATTDASAFVQGKSLDVVAAPGASPQVRGFFVRDLTPGQRVVVRGVQLNGGFFGFGGMSVFDCQGHVWVEDCEIFGGMPPGPSVRLENAASVSLHRCTLRGGNGLPGFIDIFGPVPATPGAAALSADGSVAALFDCDVLGGTGGDGIGGEPGTDGGVGVFAVNGSRVFLSGCDVRGGDTGSNPPAATVGAAAIRVPFAGPSLEWIGTQLSVGSAPVPGVLIDAPAGTATELPGTARSFTMTSPAMAGQSLSLSLNGEPGDLVFLFWSISAVNLQVPGIVGDLLVAPPFFGPISLGAITDPGGALGFSPIAPSLPPGVAGAFTLLLQPIFVTGTAAHVGGGSAFTLLGP